MENEVGEVQGDQQAARKCYVKTIQTGEKGTIPTRQLGRSDHPMEAIYSIKSGEHTPLPESDVEVIGIVLAHPERTIRIS